MIDLSPAACAWDRGAFASILCEQLKILGGHKLPLQQGLSTGGFALEEIGQVMLLSSHANDTRIHARVGVFFESVIPGCNCADDPTPVDTINEYCELDIGIDRSSGAATIRVVPGE